jgi:cellulose synthase/poly-beta-1,6-N-acetylglucosamine synthase-like glycosyltransferase
MKMLIELLIFLSTVLPLFHLFNALFARRKKPASAPGPGRPVSVLVPCYNEEDSVAISVVGLLKTGYKNLEAIYINDGSVDNTFGRLNALLDLEEAPDILLGIGTVYRSRKHPGFWVIDKPNGGKSAALNAGIRLARADVVVTLDADSVVEQGALNVIDRAFCDENVVAAGGAIHIMQGYAPKHVMRGYSRARKAVVALQMLEYLKGFYIYKLSLARQNALAIISGAFGAFRKQILLDVGGFRRTLGEDIDITISIQRHIRHTKQKVIYLPEALCCTQCPENWRDLKRQRIRWQKGFIDCAVHHRRFLLKTFLFRSLSFHFVVEALAVGTLSCLFTLMTLAAAAVMMFAEPAAMPTFLMYHVVCIVISLTYGGVALGISACYHRYPRGAWRQLLAAMLLDVLFYRYFTLLMFLGGLAAYFWGGSNAQQWNKAARCKQVDFAPNV